MKKVSNNIWIKGLIKNVLTIYLSVGFVEGNIQMTKFFRKSGDKDLPLSYAIGALTTNDLAVKCDVANSCENLKWEWGQLYDDVSTYFLKKHVVEKYAEPMALGGEIRLPILFNYGAYIDMYIEFTTIYFSYGGITLLDTLQEDGHDVNDNVPEILMISMEMRNGNNLQYKTWNQEWETHAVITTFPFTTGIVYKVTFKALGNELQTLVDDLQHARYVVSFHSSEAKMLSFSSVGILLHKIEFVA